jgi:nucleotide-binding universal stress UspA family protein
LGWYAIWGRRRTAVRGELVPLLQRERPLELVIGAVEQAAEAERHEILVPVANPTTAKSLVNLAATLARGHPGTGVAALSIAPVPVNLPLSVAQEHLERANAGPPDVLRRAAKHGAVAGVRVDLLRRAAYGVASGIIGVAESRPETRLILLGWRGPLTLGRVRASVDKEVLRSARCDVAVFLDRHLEHVQRILVPAGGGPHARLGLRMAYDLARSEGAQVVVLRVARPAEDLDIPAEELAMRHLIHRELGETGEHVSACVVPSPSVVDGILNQAAQGYDLVIIGASEEWFLRNWLFGAIPDMVAERAPCSVLLVKKHEPSSVSWTRRKLKRVRAAVP